MLTWCSARKPKAAFWKFAKPLCDKVAVEVMSKKARKAAKSFLNDM